MESTTAEASSPTTLMRPDRKVIFINLIIVDASDAIDQKLSKKFKGVPAPLAAVAKSVAKTLATPDHIASVLAQEMPKKLVEKMSSKGIMAAAETAFLEGPFVVLQMQVHAVDTNALIEAQATDDYDSDGELEEAAALDEDLAARILSWLERFLALIGIQHQKTLEEERLPRLIQSKMEIVMGEIMADKLEKKGMLAMSKVNAQEKQGRYFFDTLREIRVAKDSQRPEVKIAGAVSNAASHTKAAVSNFRAGVEEKVANFKPPKLPAGKKKE